MRTVRLLIIALMVISGITACSVTKESYLRNFNSFVENVNENGSEFNEDQWKKAEKEFNEFSVKNYQRFESDLTPQEKLKVVKLIARYRAIQVKSGIKYLKENINGLIQGTNDFIEDMQKNIE